MPLKVYLDLMSQPSRALYILLKFIKCDFEYKPVNLRKGEHFSDEYTKNVNRLQKVPVIDHNGFVLTESVAILKYLSRENIIPPDLYPKDIKQAARVEEFLEWQHIGLRLHCSMYFRIKHLNPIITGNPPSERNVASYETRMMSALDDFNSKWLGRGSDFIIGNTVTVADLLAACELEQPRMAGFDPAEKYANIATWMKKVREHFQPYYDEAHVVVNKIINKHRAQSKL